MTPHHWAGLIQGIYDSMGIAAFWRQHRDGSTPAADRSRDGGAAAPRAMAWLLASVSVMPAAWQQMLTEIGQALAAIAEQSGATQFHIEAPGARLSTMLAATLELINIATTSLRAGP